MEYRAYKIGRDGHFISYAPVIAESDEEAIATAEGLLDDHAIELWNGLRFVIRLDRKQK